MKTTVAKTSPNPSVYDPELIGARIDDIVTDILENIIIHSRTSFSNDEIISFRDKLNHTVDFVKRAHEGQFRRSGEPYVFHPLTVALDVSANHMVDFVSLFGCLLHDVMEDTHVTDQDILENFGQDVLNVVDGMTKIKNKKMESFDKFFSFSLKHPRILYIKIFDRLHNMKTIGSLPIQKQQRIAGETLNIFFKICIRLSLMDIADEMELLCNQVLQSPKVSRYTERVKELKDTLRSGFDEIEEKIWNLAREKELPLLSLEEYWKPFVNHYNYDRMIAADAFRLRVIMKDRYAAYTMMGVINEHFSHVRSSIYDYISVPRYNNHRSLRFEILHHGVKIPMSITTKEYHVFNRKGMLTYGFSEDAAKNMVYMRHLETYLKEDGDFKDIQRVFAYHNPEEITVISEDGVPYDMEKVSTALDFVFKIDPELGLRAVSAVIDGTPVPIETRLTDGDQISINSAPEPVITSASLDKCITYRSKQIITKYLNDRARVAAAGYARSFLERTLFRYQVDLDEFWRRFKQRYNENEQIEKFIGILENKNLCDVLILDLRLITQKRIQDIRTMEINFLNRMIGAWFSNRPRSQFLRVPYLDFPVGHCPFCIPVLKDSCVGVFENNRLVIHRSICRSVQNISLEKFFPLKWKSQVQVKVLVSMEILASDEYGMGNRITSAFRKTHLNMVELMGRSVQDTMVFDVKVEETSADKISHVLEKLREIKAVREIRLE